MTRRASVAHAEPAEFVCRETLARRCEVSVDTVDTWVRDNFLPPAAIDRGQIKRWHWPEVQARLIGARETEAAIDPFMKGVANADQAARRRSPS